MSTIFLSEFANPILKTHLNHLGHHISIVYSTPYVYAPVSSHPDIYLCKLGTDPAAPVLQCRPETLEMYYPGNIRYNAVCMGDYFIHNLAFTAQELLEQARKAGKQLISVKQGYTKCSMVVVNGNAAITSDPGIASSLSETALDILLVSHGHVRLKGHTYGFLGGTSGKVGDHLFFHGNLSVHPDFKKIRAFLEKHKCKFTYFKEFELEDIGSIIEALI